MDDIFYTYKEFISKRLSQLRLQKNVSAREMSLDIAQNASYINRIENGKAMPSMEGFIYICQYFQITPEEFFKQDVENPTLTNKLAEELKGLSTQQLETIRSIIRDIKKLKN